MALFKNAAAHGQAEPKKEESGKVQRRKLMGTAWGKAITIIAVTMSLFHFYLAMFGGLNPMLLRSLHLSFAGTLIFFIFPAAKFSPKNRPSIVDILFMLLFWASSFYLMGTFGTLAERLGRPSVTDLIFGVITCILVLEITRRTAGLLLSCLGLAFLLYAYFGPYLPGLLSHRGFNISRIMSTMYTTTDGIFGVTLGVSSTYIFFFMLFGAFLEHMGAGKFFIDLSYSGAGRVKGGPAQTMVLANALMGMINGTPAANVVTVGSFTFPLMNKLKYDKIFSSALAAVAATGAMIAPPVMGSAAFLMSEMTAIPYRDICLSAIGPAALFYLSLVAVTNFYATRYNKRAQPKSELPGFWPTMKEGWYHIVPIATLIYLLVIQGMSPVFSGVYSIWAMIGVVAIALVVTCFQQPKRTKELWMDFFGKIVKSLRGAAISALSVVATCAVAGFLVGVLNITGLGVKFSALMLDIAQGNMFIALVMAAVSSIILGMGLPIAACYIILAVLVAPALTQMGLPPMAAHMFILFFGSFSGITPPVAICAYAAAGMNKVNPVKVGLRACWLSLSAFVIPFIFVYGQELLLLTGTPLDIIWAFVTATIGIIGMSAGIMGYFLVKVNIIQRLLLIGGSLLCIIPGILTDAIGIAILVVVVVWQVSMKKKGIGIPTEEELAMAETDEESLVEA